MISTHHLTIARVEEILHDVIDRLDTSLGKQELVFAIQHGLALHGAKLLQQWQAKANAYPKELAIKMVQENLWFGPWFCPEGYAAREDLLVFHQHMIWVEQGILKVLAGLNRLYFPSREYKWMDVLIQKMPVAPPNLSARLKQILGLSPRAGWRELHTLIEETLSLVKSHLPEVDTIPLFESRPEVNVAWARKRWEPFAGYSLMREIGGRAN